MAKLYAPDGETPIAGTLERVPGCAGVRSATQQVDGTYDLDWDGGTEMYWDDSKTVVRDGQRVFIDEDGEEWLENELVLMEDEDA